MIFVEELLMGEVAELIVIVLTVIVILVELVVHRIQVTAIIVQERAIVLVVSAIAKELADIFLLVRCAHQIAIVLTVIVMRGIVVPV
jgi:hypothetical protein